MSQFKFSVGPWNVHEGADAFGPEVRKTIPFEKKVEKFKETGFDAVQFHDDDAVPDINHLSEEQIKKETDVETFFHEAPLMNPKAILIKGVICGHRIEEIEDDLMRQIRYLDKLIDELAKGKAMQKILRE